jgi:hypothetical protein
LSLDADLQIYPSISGIGHFSVGVKLDNTTRSYDDAFPFGVKQAQSFSSSVNPKNEIFRVKLNKTHPSFTEKKSAVQTIAIFYSGDQESALESFFRVRFNRSSSPPIVVNASRAELQAILQDLVPSSNITLQEISKKVSASNWSRKIIFHVPQNR